LRPLASFMTPLATAPDARSLVRERPPKASRRAPEPRPPAPGPSLPPPEPPRRDGPRPAPRRPSPRHED
jgi:hypothetical protein